MSTCLTNSHMMGGRKSKRETEGEGKRQRECASDGMNGKQLAKVDKTYSGFIVQCL